MLFVVVLKVLYGSLKEKRRNIPNTCIWNSNSSNYSNKLILLTYLLNKAIIRLIVFDSITMKRKQGIC